MRGKYAIVEIRRQITAHYWFQYGLQHCSIHINLFPSSDRSVSQFCLWKNLKANTWSCERSSIYDNELTALCEVWPIMEHNLGNVLDDLLKVDFDIADVSLTKAKGIVRMRSKSGFTTSDATSKKKQFALWYHFENVQIQQVPVSRFVVSKYSQKTIVCKWYGEDQMEDGTICILSTSKIECI